MYVESGPKMMMVMIMVELERKEGRVSGEDQ
jgi:hypothetical protein